MKVTKLMQEKNEFVVNFIAMCVRNCMEDFHVEHLSDEQMKELNPLIRKGILSALLALGSDDYKCFRKLNTAMIPDYWEFPREIDNLDTDKYLYKKHGNGVGLENFVTEFLSGLRCREV